MRAALYALALLALPVGLYAATVESSRTLIVSEIPQGNAYLAGAELTVTTPITGDLSAAGGSVVVSAPVVGDVFITGGTIDLRKPISGDARVGGGKILIEDTVGGDLVAVGGSVTMLSTPSFVWAAAGTINLEHGSKGPVTLFAGTAFLSGEFTGDVTITASDRITLEKGTVIHGKLLYDAPEQLQVPDGVVVDGGVTYTGTSYLPTTAQAQTFAIAGAGVFFLVRILAAVIGAGLFAGLFPRFAQAVADRALSFSVKRFILLTLLGFGALVATPVLILLLLVSFAGAGIAFVLIAAYMLLILLAYFYAAVIAGAALARHIVKRETFFWRDAVFGMLALSVVSLIPVIGWFVFIILLAAAAGTMLSLFYRFAYPRDTDVLEIE